MRRVVRSLQVPAASRSLDLPRPRRQRAPSAAACDSAATGTAADVARRRVRVRTRRALPTTRTRTARRASSSHERGCVANAGSRPPRALDLANLDLRGFFSFQKFVRRSQNASIIRTSRCAISERRSVERHAEHPAGRAYNGDWWVTPNSEAGTTRPPGSPPTKRNLGSLRGSVAIRHPRSAVVVTSRSAPRSAATRRVDSSLPCGRRIVSR